MEQAKKALLVMDMQTSILSLHPGLDGLILNVAKAIAKAREKSLPIIYVVVGFRPGMPEVSLSNKKFSRFKRSSADAFLIDNVKIASELTPQAGDVIVSKRRFSAFTGSDLEVVLRGQNVRHLVLTGVSTSGVVLSTLREAADKDYQATVISDCCADGDDEVHRILMTKVFPVQSDVVQLADWVI